MLWKLYTVIVSFSLVNVCNMHVFAFTTMDQFVLAIHAVIFPSSHMSFTMV